MKISTIIDKVDNKGMFVPAFQREFVWKRENAKALLNSLLKNYPTGTILTWETMNPPELKKAEYKPEMGSVLVVLDGQQRITTLYMLITGNLPPYYRAEEIENDVRGLYYNLLTGELEYYIQAKMKNDPLWIDVTHVFTKDIKVREIMQKYEEVNGVTDKEELYKVSDQVLDNLMKLKSIKDRDFPQLEVPSSANIIEAIDIFDIVNSSGTKLTEAELALAQITGKWPQARDVFKKKLQDLKSAGYEFDLDFIVYLLQAVIHFSGSDMNALHKDSAEVIQEAWNKLDKKILDYTINILKNRAFIDSTKELSSDFNLVPFIAYIYKQHDNTLTEKQLNDGLNWLLLSLLWQRYINQTPQRLDSDLRIVRANTSPFEELRNNIYDERGRLDLKPDDLVGRTTSHPAYKLMILALKANNAICWGTGNSLRNNIGENYKIEWDHIFPYSKLIKNGYGRENHLKYKLAQELTNRALITKGANLSKLAKEPVEYLPLVNEKYPGALEKQFIPMDPELWKMESFEKFLEVRRRILAEAINDFISNFTKQTAEIDGVNISQIISKRESDNLEFKSSLWTDAETGELNKNLEKVIIKTVAGFMNSDGGQLVIGVDDSGDVKGLDADYKKLGNKESSDEFELHFNSIFKSMIGIEYRHYVTLNFQKIDEKEVCLVTVKPCSEPVYVEVEGKEEFYVRTGNSTNPVSRSEEKIYVKSHWG